MERESFSHHRASISSLGLDQSHDELTLQYSNSINTHTKQQNNTNKQCNSLSKRSPSPCSSDSSPFHLTHFDQIDETLSSPTQHQQQRRMSALQLQHDELLDVHMQQCQTIQQLKQENEELKHSLQQLKLQQQTNTLPRLTRFNSLFNTLAIQADNTEQKPAVDNTNVNNATVLSSTSESASTSASVSVGVDEEVFELQQIISSLKQLISSQVEEIQLLSEKLNSCNTEIQRLQLSEEQQQLQLVDLQSAVQEQRRHYKEIMSKCKLALADADYSVETLQQQIQAKRVEYEAATVELKELRSILQDKDFEINKWKTIASMNQLFVDDGNAMEKTSTEQELVQTNSRFERLKQEIVESICSTDRSNSATMEAEVTNTTATAATAATSTTTTSVAGAEIQQQ